MQLLVISHKKSSVHGHKSFKINEPTFRASCGPMMTIKLICLLRIAIKKQNIILLYLHTAWLGINSGQEFPSLPHAQT